MTPGHSVEVTLPNSSKEHSLAPRWVLRRKLPSKAWISRLALTPWHKAEMDVGSNFLLGQPQGQVHVPLPAHLPQGSQVRFPPLSVGWWERVTKGLKGEEIQVQGPVLLMSRTTFTTKEKKKLGVCIQPRFIGGCSSLASVPGDAWGSVAHLGLECRLLGPSCPKSQETPRICCPSQAHQAVDRV